MYCVRRFDRKKRRMTPSWLLLVLPAVLIMGACKKHVAATVACSDMSMQASELGVLNLPKLTNGVLLWLDSKNHMAQRIITLKLTPAQLSPPTPVIDTTSLISKANFSIKMGANVPQTVQADVHTYVNSHTEYLVDQSSRTDIADPLGILNASAVAKARAASVPANDVLLFVSGEVKASKLGIALQSQSGAGASAKVITFGDFEVTVEYDCASSVGQLASKGAPLLWKGIQVAYNPTTSSFTVGNKAFDLKEYSWYLGF